jgi:agarase
MRLESVGVAVVSLALCSSAAAASAQDRTEAPGFFRTKQVDGRWWLVDPAGELFISKGVTTVSFHQDRIRGTQISPYGETNTAKYGSIAAWRDAAAKRLLGWGFNTLGAWSDEELCQVQLDGKHLVCAPTIDQRRLCPPQDGQG